MTDFDKFIVKIEAELKENSEQFKDLLDTNKSKEIQKKIVEEISDENKLNSSNSKSLGDIIK